MTTPARFWDRMADRYAARPVRDEAAYADTLARTRAHLAPDMRALELGCGTGTTALRLADAVAQFHATDFSARMIAIAEAKPGAPNLAFRQAAIDGIEPPVGGFDAVLAFNLLHLLPDLDAALARIAGLLRPGGVFVSKSVCLRDAPAWLRPVVWAMRAIGMAPELRRYSAAELDRAIAAAGLEIVETRTYPGLAPSRFVVARRT